MTGTSHPLRFLDLSPLAFERMCLWLAEAEGFERSELHGTGGPDQGRDIRAMKRGPTLDPQLWYFQCKRREHLGVKNLTQDIDKVRQLAQAHPRLRPHGIVFAVAGELSLRSRDSIREHARRSGFDCVFWTRSELDEKVKGHPYVLAEFFQIRPATATGLIPAEGIRFGSPAPTHHFVGREQELEVLHLRLTQTNTFISRHALTGLGGVGKTSLATRYVEVYGAEYPIKVWIRAEDGGVADLSRFAHSLGLVADNTPPEESCLLATRWLEEQRELWLIVFDNAEEPGQVEACCPTTGTGRIIITSRDRQFEQFGSSMAIKSLDTDAAALYLTERTRRADEAAAAQELAVALGGLPLALAHAGAYCSAGTGFAEYLTLLEGLPAAALFDTSPETFYEKTVATTWLISIEAAAKQAHLARPILSLASYLAPDGIPTYIFDALLEDADDPRSRKALLDGLLSLNRYSLAKVTETSLSVHRLLQKVVRDELRGRNDRASEFLALEAVIDAHPDDPSEPGSWPTCEALLPQVAAIGQLVRVPEAGERLNALLNRSCRFLVNAGGGRRAVTATRTTLNTCIEDLGPDHPETLQATANLASAYVSINRIQEAVVMEEQLVLDYERVLGPDHVDTLRARGNLACTYQLADRTDDMVTMEERLLADFGRTLGDGHVNTARARGNLAGSYLSDGRIDEAIELGEGAVADLSVLLGVDHPNTLQVRANLATAYDKTGDLERSIGIEEDIRALALSSLGAEHPITLAADLNVATGYRKVGRTAEAIEIGERALLLSSRVLGSDLPLTVMIRKELTKAHEALEAPN